MVVIVQFDKYKQKMIPPKFISICKSLLTISAATSALLNKTE
jgi:hypothetical protein